jgi:hypothetical protein|tara:strand:- start:88 stop:282 length:195 start_codon:yes stop_codon:yes gene_type:complete
MSLKLIVNNKEAWDAMLEELESCIQSHYRSMANQTNADALFRHQGAIHELGRLKMLREKVNGKP